MRWRRRPARREGRFAAFRPFHRQTVCIRSARVFTFIVRLLLEMADAQSFRAWWDTTARQGQAGATRQSATRQSATRHDGDDKTTRELRWEIFCNSKQLREELFQAINVGVDY